MPFYVPKDQAKRFKDLAPKPRQWSSDEEAMSAERGAAFDPFTNTSEEGAPRGGVNPAFTLDPLPPGGNPFLNMQAQQSQAVFDRNAAMPNPTPGQSAAAALGALGTELDRPRGALFAAHEAGGATAGPQGIFSLPGLKAMPSGFLHPEQYTGDKLLEREGVGDTDLWGEKRFLPDHMSARNLIGGGADMALDPGNLVGAKWVKGGAEALAATDVARSALGKGARTAEEAVTGSPATLDVFRRSTGEQLAGRGTYYSTTAEGADLASGMDLTTKGRVGSVAQSTVTFRNPLVVDSLDQAGQLHPGIAAQLEAMKAPGAGTLEAFSDVERKIADAAARAGHDGIVFRGGDLTEVVDLRSHSALRSAVERARPGAMQFAGSDRAAVQFDATPLALIDSVAKLPSVEELAPRLADIQQQLAQHTSATTGAIKKNKATSALLKEQGELEGLMELRQIVDAGDGDAERVGRFLEEALVRHEDWELSRTANRGSVRGPSGTGARGARAASDIAGAPAEEIEVLRARAGVLNEVFGALDRAESLDELIRPIDAARSQLDSPAQATLDGGSVPTFRPENTPNETQAGLGIGAGEQPIESLPLFQGATPATGASSPPGAAALAQVDTARELQPPPSAARTPIWAGKTTPDAPESAFPWSDDTFTRAPGEPPAMTPSGRAPGPSGQQFEPASRRPSPLLPREYRGRQVPAAPNAIRHNKATGMSAVKQGQDWYDQAAQAMPSGVRDALAQVDEMAAPRAGNAVRSALTPARGQSPRVWRAWQAMGNTEADISTRLISWEARTIDALDDLFGGTDHIDADYIGPSTRGQAVVENGNVVVRDVSAEQWLPNDKGVSATGTFKDMLEHPDYYDLTPAQRQALRDFNIDNLTISDDLRSQYGLEIGDYTGTATPQQVANGDFGYLPTVNASEEIEAAADANRISKPGSSGRMKEREFASMSARAEFDPHFVPITDVATLLPALNRAKARGAARNVFDAGVGGAREAGDRALIQASNGAFLPAKEAKDVKELMELFTPGNIVGRFIRGTESANEAALSGDFSPIFIHGTLGFLGKPLRTAELVAGGLAKAVKEGDPLRFAKPQVLAEEIETAVRNGDTSWIDFAQQKGMPFVKSVQEEFSGGWIRKIPGLGPRFSRMNEALYTIVVRHQKGLWEQVTESLERKGLAHDQAMSESMRVVERLIPTANPRRVGASQYRSVLERLPFTSISFIRQPLAMAETATRGLVKLGANPMGWKNLTTEEQLAVEIMLKFHATAAGLASTTTALNAHFRGDDVTERVTNSLNPSSGGFLNVYDPTGLTGWHISLGGPYRGTWKAVAPRKMELPGGHEAWVPFAGIPMWLTGRVQVTAGRALELQKNKDFEGYPIMTSDFAPYAALQGLAHMATGAVPLTASQPIESLRHGDSFTEGAVKTAGQQLGVNAQNESFSVERNRAVRDAGFKNADGTPATTWDQLGSGDRAMLLEQNPDLKARQQKELSSGVAKGEEWAENQQALDARYAKTFEAQSVDDKLLDDGGMALTDWKDNRKVRLAEQRGAVQEIMKGVEQQAPDPAKPWTLYYAKLREAEQLGGGTISDEGWDTIDAWRGTLPPEQNAAIDRQLGFRSTPKEQEYRSDLARLSESGYFEIRDKAWSVARVADPSAKDFSSKADWELSVHNKVRGVLEKKGIPTDGEIARELNVEMFKHLPASAAYEDAREPLMLRWFADNLKSENYRLVSKWEMGTFPSDVRDILAALDAKKAIAPAKP